MNNTYLLALVALGGGGLAWYLSQEEEEEAEVPAAPRLVEEAAPQAPTFVKESIAIAPPPAPDSEPASVPKLSFGDKSKLLRGVGNALKWSDLSKLPTVEADFGDAYSEAVSDKMAWGKTLERAMKAAKVIPVGKRKARVIIPLRAGNAEVTAKILPSGKIKLTEANKLLLGARKKSRDIKAAADAGLVARRAAEKKAAEARASQAAATSGGTSMMEIMMGFGMAGLALPTWQKEAVKGGMSEAQLKELIPKVDSAFWAKFRTMLASPEFARAKEGKTLKDWLKNTYMKGLEQQAAQRGQPFPSRATQSRMLSDMEALLAQKDISLGGLSAFGYLGA